MNEDQSDSEMMVRTQLARLELLNLTGTKKPTAWRQCVKFAGYVLAVLTALSAFATTPSLAATVNISCFKDVATGDCVFVGDSATGTIKTSVIGSAGGTSSTFGAAFPATGTAGGFSDGTNMQGGRAFDMDTGGGTEYNIGVSLRKAAAGGSVIFGTSTDPIFVNCSVGCAGGSTTPTDAFPNPTTAGISMVFPTMWNGATWDLVRGTIAGGLLTNVSNTFLLDATFTARINTLGQKTMANSTPVVLSSDQSAIPVTVGTIALPSNAAQETGGNLATLASLSFKTATTPLPSRSDYRNTLTFAAALNQYCQRTLCSPNGKGIR